MSNKVTNPLTIHDTNSSSEKSVKTTFRAFSGPIPDPDSILRYNAINPKFAEFFMDQASKEQAHRHDCDLKRLTEQTKARKGENQSKMFGQICALIVVVCVFFLAGYFGHIGQPEQSVSILKCAGMAIGAAAVFMGIRMYNHKVKGTNNLDEY